MSVRQLFQRPARAIALVVLASILGCEAAPQADSGPQLPCGSEPFPRYPDVDSPPTVKVWDRSELGREWKPPGCTGWSAPGFSTLVVTAARFHYVADAESMLRHIGAISELSGMRYWSTTHKRWQTLIPNAYALSGPAGDQPRKDFSPDEMVEGSTLYFHQEDNLSGKAVYQMHIMTVSPERLVFSTENTSGIRFLLVPLFQPGEIQAVYFLERESPDVWRYYSVARTGKKASSLTAGHEASSINRAVAYYRYLVGVPTDREPPAAR
jgi:hypothetical protein